MFSNVALIVLFLAVFTYSGLLKKNLGTHEDFINAVNLIAELNESSENFGMSIFRDYSPDLKDIDSVKFQNLFKENIPSPPKDLHFTYSYDLDLDQNSKITSDEAEEFTRNIIFNHAYEVAFFNYKLPKLSQNKYSKSFSNIVNFSAERLIKIRQLVYKIVKKSDELLNHDQSTVFADGYLTKDEFFKAFKFVKDQWKIDLLKSITKDGSQLIEKNLAFNIFLNLGLKIEWSEIESILERKRRRKF